MAQKAATTTTSSSEFSYSSNNKIVVKIQRHISAQSNTSNSTTETTDSNNNSNNHDIATPIISNRFCGTTNSSKNKYRKVAVMELPPAATSSLQHQHNDARYMSRSLREATNGPNNSNDDNDNNQTTMMMNTTICIPKNVTPRFSSTKESPIVMSRSSYYGEIDNNNNDNDNSITTNNNNRRRHRSCSSSNNIQQQHVHHPVQIPIITTTCLMNNSSIDDVGAILLADICFRAMAYTVPIVKNKLKHTLLTNYVQKLNNNNNNNNIAYIQGHNTDCNNSSNNNNKRRYNQPQLTTTTITKTTSSTMLHRNTALFQQQQQVRGIPNYGQTCFLNSILQALASLEPIMVYLERIVDMNHERIINQESSLLFTAAAANTLLHHDEQQKTSRFFSFGNNTFQFNPTLLPFSIGNNKNKSTSSSSLLCDTLLDILMTVNGHHSSSNKNRLDPRSILQIVGKKHDQFSPRTGVHNDEQQDAQELLQAVLDIIIEEGEFDKTNAAIPSQFASIFTTENNMDSFLLSESTQHHMIHNNNNIIPLHAVVLEQRKRKQNNLLPTQGSSLPLSHATSIGGGGGGGVGHIGNSNRNTNNVDDDCQHSSGSSSPNTIRMLSTREEKKQEEFEFKLPHVASEESLLLHRKPPIAPVQAVVVQDNNIEYETLSVESYSQDQQHDPPLLSKSMEIVTSTTSSITPSPFSGWVGSALMCRDCRHVRPIHNTPFIDIPVVPTAISQYLSRSKDGVKPGAREPPCQLEECLEEFTSIERVHDVECKHCTIQKEMKELDSEKKVLEQTIRGLLSSRSRRSSSGKQKQGIEEFKYLREELLSVEAKLNAVRSASSDDDEPIIAKLMTTSDDNDNHDIIEERIPLQRCDAFKCLLLTRLPAILSIHVQRRYYDPITNRTSKTMQHVIFPEVLDVSPYCAYGGCIRQEAPFAGTTTTQQQQQRIGINTPIHYKLMAVIEHRGGPYSGHYVCFRRNTATNTGWYWISDDSVRQCSWADVRNCQAYMLFYEAM